MMYQFKLNTGPGTMACAVKCNLTLDRKGLSYPYSEHFNHTTTSSCISTQNSFTLQKCDDLQPISIFPIHYKRRSTTALHFW